MRHAWILLLLGACTPAAEPDGSADSTAAVAAAAAAPSGPSPAAAIEVAPPRPGATNPSLAADGDAPLPGAADPSGKPAAEPAASPGAVAAGLARATGRVSYPSEEIPVMRVCALAAADAGRAVCVRTEVNAIHYTLDLPAGRWWLLAWPQQAGTEGEPGLLSAASDCLGAGGMGCDDHALLDVVLTAGEVREGLDINDWYYDPQATPPPAEPAY